MAHSPLSILSQADFNGDPLTDELLMKTFHQLMDEQGYVLMCNVPEAFDPVRFCRNLGRFVPNYTGAVVGDVRPEPGMDDVYHAGNTRPLTPHSEGYDFAVAPPRYIALWCVTPADGPGGETTLADTRPWVEALSAEERAGQGPLRRRLRHPVVALVLPRPTQPGSGNRQRYQPQPLVPRNPRGHGPGILGGPPARAQRSADHPRHV
ncbi:TauD/TfdA family dioxygenase [Streptomyces sp. NPDC049915]|uniref:TauD/TfdA family dioxygenase n=1 Tax=Streptomyces sp. NPDC049915 TaxID=3155510 RepID=UPI00341A41B8